MQGRPVLAGTRSVAASEQLSRIRDEAGLAHVLLNARQDQQEAENYCKSQTETTGTNAASAVGDQRPAATRITLRPHDPGTGEEIEKREVVKGYYRRGEFVTFTAEQLKALDVESSKVIDLEKFAPRDDIDPVYFDSSYYLHRDGPIAVEARRVIGAAIAEAGVVGLGRLTLSRRERMVMLEPRGAGVALFTLRAAEEVRAAQFGVPEGEPDAEMVAIAKAIIAQRTGSFDPSAYRDRYEEAFRELIEAKMKGLPIKPQTVSAPSPVIDLMVALKRSLLGKGLAKSQVHGPRPSAGGARPIDAKLHCCCRCPAGENGSKRSLPRRRPPRPAGARKPNPTSPIRALLKS
jgi:DNA end-binding protein Ku